MIAMRDGDAELRSQHAAWARSTLTEALQSKDDPAHCFRTGLRFNPAAIAFAGMVYSLKDDSSFHYVHTLLDTAARNNPAAAHGSGATASTLAAIDERLPCTILRGALNAAIRPTRRWDASEEDVTAGEERYRQRVQDAVQSELAWLAGNGAEPSWPAFPPVFPPYSTETACRTRTTAIRSCPPVPGA